jgi:hypothetical protein
MNDTLVNALLENVVPIASALSGDCMLANKQNLFFCESLTSFANWTAMVMASMLRRERRRAVSFLHLLLVCVSFLLVLE